MELSRFGLVIGVVTGVVLIGLGLAARRLAVEPDVSYGERVDQWLERADGTVILFDYEEVEGEAWQPRYEVVPVDSSTSMVRLVDPFLGVSSEVFRGNTQQAEAAFGSEEVDVALVAELIDDTTVGVFRVDEVRDVRLEYGPSPIATRDPGRQGSCGIVPLSQ